MNTNPLLEVIAAQEQGQARGMPSICSANHYVLKAAFAHARANGLPLLIESTCNQVNQEGGYTGLTPFDFMSILQELSARYDYAPDRLIVGGDHLGPNPWRHEPAESAMAKARILVHDYVRAGYTKLHLDTSMRCADDDPRKPLSTAVISARAAGLARVAEETWATMNTAVSAPLYVMGTEVPTPGGAQDSHEGAPVVTSPESVTEVIAATLDAFDSLGLEDAWERVIAVVVQPGVEFSSEKVFDYTPSAAIGLSRAIEGHERLVYEAHSTDYQTREALGELVRDHFAILKVGPGLTFALREAIFALSSIEDEWLMDVPGITLSNLRDVLDAEMLENPQYWQGYYPGDAQQQKLARCFSLSDRIRYYWPSPVVQGALGQLMYNLSQEPIPLPLISQYLPAQFRAVREGQLTPDPESLVQFAITAVLNDYASACALIPPQS